MVGYMTITELIKDNVTLFLSERTIRDPAGAVGATELFGAWQEWCRERGEYAASCTAFGRELGSRSTPRVRRSTGVAYLGFRIKEEK